MKNEEAQDIINSAVEKFPYSRCGSGRLIHEQTVWFAIREAFNRGFERGEKSGKEDLIKELQNKTSLKDVCEIIYKENKC